MEGFSFKKKGEKLCSKILSGFFSLLHSVLIHVFFCWLVLGLWIWCNETKLKCSLHIELLKSWLTFFIIQCLLVWSRFFALFCQCVYGVYTLYLSFKRVHSTLQSQKFKKNVSELESQLLGRSPLSWALTEERLHPWSDKQFLQLLW